MCMHRVFYKNNYYSVTIPTDATFTEVRRQFETPLNRALNTNLNANLFDEFFNYLSSFLITSDLCDLSYLHSCLHLAIHILFGEGFRPYSCSKVSLALRCYMYACISKRLDGKGNQTPS